MGLVGLGSGKGVVGDQCRRGQRSDGLRRGSIAASLLSGERGVRAPLFTYRLCLVEGFESEISWAR